MLTLSGEMERKIRKNIILKKRCDVNDIECHVIMTLSGERGREHWPFPRLTAGAVCIVLYTVCITVWTTHSVQCASMYKCAPHVCSVYQCTVWLSIELCASMYALYTHWLHCNALYAHFASMWALYNTMHTLLQNVYNIHTANYIVYTLCSLNWTLAVHRTVLHDIFQMICCDTVSKGRDRN